MNARTYSALVLLALGGGIARAQTAPVPFDHYQVILDRKPFGETPNAADTNANAAAAIAAAVEAFTTLYRLCSIVEADDGGVQAGLVNLKTNKPILLRVGEDEQDGLKLVRVDFNEGEAVFQRGEELVPLKIRAGSAGPGAGPAGTVGAPPGGPRPSFFDRRRMREEPPPAPTPAAVVIPQPKLSGPELEKHLQEYQMEVIRKGMPALPIPLTEEMDSALVKEGVLPPR